MIRKIIFLSALLLPAAFASAQSMEWSGKFGGDGEDVVLAMHADASGNTYTTGYFTNTCDFDITGNTYNLTTGTLYDCFVQKNAPDGSLLWAKKVGGPSGDNGTKITTDSAGNVYVTGVFQETADFDPGPEQFLITSSGSLDIFIVKLSPEGDFIWAKTFEGPEYEETNGLGTDADGNLYISGYFYFPVDFNPGDEVFEMEPAGSGDGFVVKLNSNGDFVWAKSFGGEDFDLATGMKVMPSGDVYVSGNFSLTADFDPSATGVYELTADENHSGIFLLHLKSNGDFSKAVRVAHVAGESYGLSVDVDNTGAAYVTGYLGAEALFATQAGTVTMGPTQSYTSYIAKVNADGTVAWAKQLISDNLTFAYAVAVNSQNEVLVSGYYKGTLSLGSINLTESNVADTMNYIVKLDSNGNYIWAQDYGGINFIDRCAIAVDGNDNTYLTSAFEGTVDINPHPGQVNEVTVTDFRDNFIIKLNNEPLSVKELQANASVKLYPNPSRGIMNILSDEPLITSNYIIYDVIGRKVATGILNSSQQFDISALQTGQYNLQIGNTTFRIIKE